YRHRLAPEIGSRRYGSRVAPPWVADQMLAGYSQADQRLGIARGARQRRQEPALRLRRELGAHALMPRALRPRQPFGDPMLDARAGKGATAGRLQYQDLKLSRNPPCYFRLDCSEVFRAEFMPSRPQEFRGGRIGNPHIESQRRRVGALDAATDNVIVSPLGI